MVHLCDNAGSNSHVLETAPPDAKISFLKLEFSPDSKRLATVLLSATAGPQPPSVWDVATGQRLASFPGPEPRTEARIFTPDARSLIIDGPRSPRIWHFDPRPEPASPAGRKDEAWAAAYPLSGKLLATGSDDTDERQTIKIWDTASGHLKNGWHAGLGTVAALAFSPDGQILASGHLTEQDNVRLWDVSTGKLIKTLWGPPRSRPDARVLS
jgi:eukaryotic-like serine/threonine-protein kinase